MTWPREQGHISRSKGHRHLKFSENFKKKGLKSSYSKNQISSFKNKILIVYICQRRCRCIVCSFGISLRLTCGSCSTYSPAVPHGWTGPLGKHVGSPWRFAEPSFSGVVSGYIAVGCFYLNFVSSIAAADQSSPLSGCLLFFDAHSQRSYSSDLALSLSLRLPSLIRLRLLLPLHPEQYWHPEHQLTTYLSTSTHFNSTSALHQLTVLATMHNC